MVTREVGRSKGNEGIELRAVKASTYGKQRFFAKSSDSLKASGPEVFKQRVVRVSMVRVVKIYKRVNVKVLRVRSKAALVSN